MESRRDPDAAGHRLISGTHLPVAVEETAEVKAKAMQLEFWPKALEYAVTYASDRTAPEEKKKRAKKKRGDLDIFKDGESKIVKEAHKYSKSKTEYIYICESFP